MQRKKICRYFERGSCKKEKCPFVHLHENKKNCQFFMRGSCRKGANCNFYHPPKQTKQQKEIRKQFQPQVVKKQKQHDYKEQYEEQQQKDEAQETLQQKQQQLIKEPKIEQGQQYQRLVVGTQEEDNKQRRVALLLGLSESQYSDSEQEVEKTEEEPQKKMKPVNFTKIYPKKFPDYSKNPETKRKIQQNEQKYFKGKKFLEFLNSLHDPAEKQYYQILRKFQDSFTLEQEIEDPQVKEYQPKLYRIKMRPLLYQTQINLNFEMIQDNIQIQIDCRKYPQERAQFQIMNLSIPESYKEKLTGSLKKIHEKKSIFETLKTFMNNFQRIYELAKSKLENQYFSEIELEKKIEKTLSREAQNQQKRKKKPKKDKKPQNENPDVTVHRFPVNEKIQVGNMNYDIIIQSLFIQNCEYILVQRILLYIQCICEKKILHILESDRKEMKIGVKLQCKKCNIMIGIALNREVMQLRSTFVGKLGIDNGRLLEVAGISWRIGCACDEEILKNKIYLSGQRLNINCHQCFKNMQIHYMGLKFFNPFLEFNITQNKQLPHKGACKHKKLSFRWVRYGCCGRMFSCDECHIRGSTFAHEKVQGTTMMCGFCSIEQPIAKQCVNCKKQLARGIDKSGHWQGGMGCRDQTLLSRKDAKKYTGATKKK